MTAADPAPPGTPLRPGDPPPPAPGRPWPLPANAEPAAAPRRPPAVDSLTAVRGVAAVWVVLFHFKADLHALLPLDWAAPLIARGHLAVPLFFVLSGYVLALNYAAAFGRGLTASGTKEFLLRRLIRIYPLHLATLLGTAVMAAVGTRLGGTPDPEKYGLVDFLLNLALVHAWVPFYEQAWNYPSWSISAEWFAYLLFPPLAAGLWRVSAGQKGRAAVGLIAGLALAATLAIALFWGALGLPYAMPASVVGPFTVGAAAWVFQARATNPWRPPGWTLWATVLLLVVGASLPGYRRAAAATLVASVGVVVLLGAAGNRSPRAFRWGPLVALGEASYALYLTHAMAQKVLYTLLPSGRFAESDLAVRLGVVAAYVAVIAAAAWLAQATIERRLVPWLRRRATATRPETPGAPAGPHSASR